MKNSAIAAALLCLAATTACQTAETRGPEGQHVTATLPISMKIHRGESAPVEIPIEREKFDGPVTVSISQLPKGVAADRPSMTVQSTSATFVLVADKAADLVTHQAVTVTVEGPPGRRAMQYVDLSVTD
jgi:hypothetical protein